MAPITIIMLACLTFGIIETAKGRESCGCQHKEVEKHFPGEYTDIIALHLSDINGLPMYAVENGYYHFKEDSAKGFDYIRLPEDQRNALVRDEEEFAALVESLKPMYKQQAEDCIKRHNLTVTGDRQDNGSN